MSLEEITQLVAPYGIHPKKVQLLDGYASKNYLIEDDTDRKFVIKHYQAPEELPFIEAEVRITKKIAKNLPFAISSSSTTSTPTIHRFHNGSFARLLPFIEGRFLFEVEHTENLLYHLGQTAARLDAQLMHEYDPVIESRRLHWDLQYIALSKPKLTNITDPVIRKTVRYFIDQCESFALPDLQSMRKSIIHNDLNDHNVLVDQNKVTGVIDFGDMAYSPLINELAIALTYCMMDKPFPIEVAVAMVKGYHSIIPLMHEELRLLQYLVPARLCISLCSSAEAKANQHASDYITIDEERCAALLEKWLTINPINISDQLLRSVDYPSCIHPVRERLQVLRNKDFSGALSLSYAEPIHMVKAAFQYMYDAEGHCFLDAYNNIPLIGHCHPNVSEALSRQTRQLNTNTRYLYDSITEYSGRLLTHFPKSLSKVFLVNSGSAASDLAFRLAKNYTGNEHFLVLNHGYHGNTSAAIQLSSYKFEGKGGTGQPAHITALKLPKEYKGEFGSADEYVADAKKRIEDLIRKDIVPAALLAEPISGCGGQVPLAPGYLQSLKPFLEQHGILLIIDEVQTGFGRMGDHFWGYEMHGVVPDMVILGKPMGNGHPIGGVVCTESISEAFANGMEFFSSFGGNPVSCEVGKAVLSTLEEENLPSNAAKVGLYWKNNLKNLAARHPQMADVRGKGLFLGIELENEDGSPGTVLAQQLVNQLRQRLILSSTDGPYNNVIKVKPPLCFNKTNVDHFIEEFDQLIRASTDQFSF